MFPRFQNGFPMPLIENISTGPAARFDRSKLFGRCLKTLGLNPPVRQDIKPSQEGKKNLTHATQQPRPDENSSCLPRYRDERPPTSSTRRHECQRSSAREPKRCDANAQECPPQVQVISGSHPRPCRASGDPQKLFWVVVCPARCPGYLVPAGAHAGANAT